MRKTAACMLILIALAGQSPLLAALSARNIVERAYAAERKATLQGVALTTVRVDGRTATARVKVFRSGGRTRMEYLTGPSAGMVMIESADTVTTIPAKGKGVCTCIQRRSSDDLDKLLRNYVPKAAGSERVAGRECYSIRLEPRFKGNPGGRIWVDKRSYIILGTERLGSDGKLLSRTRYESADFSARPPDSLFRTPSDVTQSAEQRWVSEEEVRNAVGFAPMKPAYVPKGYDFGGYYVRRMPCGSSFVALRYVNGLNTISVFESRCACTGPACGGPGGRGCGRGRQGGRGRGVCMLADRPQARMLHTKVGDVWVVVVGDAPESELTKIVESVG